MRTQSFTRDEFYELVWSEPITKIAAKLSITGTAIAKACKLAEIPVPPRGYWAKAKFGKLGRRTPLPPRGIGMPDEVTFGPRNRWYHHLEVSLDDPMPAQPEFPDDLEQLTDSVRKRVGKVTVPRLADRTHPLVAKLLAEDDERRRKRDVLAYPSFYDRPLYDSPFEQRRLRFLNALFLAFSRYGATPSVRGRDGREIGVRVGAQHVSISLDRPGVKVDPYRSILASEMKGPNLLKLGVPSWQAPDGFEISWVDKKESPIERHLSEIVVELIMSGERHHRRRATARYEWIVERREQIRAEIARQKEEYERKEQERLRKLEEHRIAALLGQATAFRQANDLRQFVAQVQMVVTVVPHSESERALNDWAAWVPAQADRLDPVVNRAYLTLMHDA